MRPVSGDTVVYLIVGLAAAVGLYYAYSRARQGVGSAVENLLALPGQAIEKIAELAIEAGQTVVAAPGRLYDATNEANYKAVMDNPLWAGF